MTGVQCICGAAQRALFTDLQGLVAERSKEEEPEALMWRRAWQLGHAPEPKQHAVQWQGSLEGILRDIPEVLAKRSAEKEHETLRARQAWQQAAASLALALMSGAGISACKCLPHASGAQCESG